MCFSQWSMHFFLRCMCFTRKGMCLSTMNNASDGTTLYYWAGISAALHIHALRTRGSASAGRHASDAVIRRWWCTCVWIPQPRETRVGEKGMESPRRWICLLNEKNYGIFFLVPPPYKIKERKAAKCSWKIIDPERQPVFRLRQIDITWDKERNHTISR